MDFKNTNLGFTPISKDDAFELAPRLEKIFNIENCDVYFKQVSNPTIAVQNNQNIFQGSLIMPDNNSCIDFELATNFLSSSSTISVAPRDEKDAPKFGFGRTEFRTFENLSTDNLLSRLLIEVEDAPNTLGFERGNSLNSANDEITKAVNKLNKLAKMEQSMRKSPGQNPTDELRRSAEGRDIR
ncbi:hypothetical protein C9J27_24175 [Photobacterium kishitanii]|uniref:Uncharacterized protein n=2 Tax=Photobacterium kishitanii TaxID=318456 RepID=A0A2T3KAX8_9GAMM|nr:hypothetical protein C9J27_24175 [Photobacterium kishitanii]